VDTSQNNSWPIKTIKFGLTGLRWILKRLFQLVCYVIYFMAGGNSSGLKRDETNIQEDKGPDDIWKQTSGDTYYSNDPPKPFD